MVSTSTVRISGFREYFIPKKFLKIFEVPRSVDISNCHVDQKSVIRILSPSSFSLPFFVIKVNTTDEKEITLYLTVDSHSQNDTSIQETVSNFEHENTAEGIDYR